MDRTTISNAPTLHARIEFAKWILERNLQWIAAAEVKVGAIATLNVAMAGGMAAAVGASKSPMLLYFAALAAVPLVIGLGHTAWTVFPRLSGPRHSLVFFGRVAKTDESNYADALLVATDEDLFADLAAQIHRNAEIAAQKHRLVRRAAIWSYLSLPGWIGAVYLSLKLI